MNKTLKESRFSELVVDFIIAVISGCIVAVAYYFFQNSN